MHCRKTTLLICQEGSTLEQRLKTPILWLDFLAQISSSDFHSRPWAGSQWGSLDEDVGWNSQLKQIKILNALRLSEKSIV